MEGEITLVAVAVVAFALVSARVSRFALTMPMVFVALGALADGAGVVEIDLDAGGVVLIGEVTLAVILFGDAVRIDLGALRRELGLPARLLTIGLPLSVGLGAAVVFGVIPGITWWEAALVAAVLAPTDAALGQAVIEDEAVPLRVRQGLNVESGLNDGLIVPAVLVFAALATGEGETGLGFWISLAARQLGLGLVIGVLVGAIGGRLVVRSVAAGAIEGIYAQLATLAVAVTAFAGALTAEANGFIAAFAAGLAYGQVTGDRAEHLDEYTEDTGRLLAIVAFFLFGNLFVLDALSVTTTAVVICAVASLTAGRIIPVALAMVGVGARWQTTLFIGWFGPRGLASILFGLLLVEEDLPAADELFAIIAWTVVASIFLHGATAARGASSYGRWYQSMPDQEREAMPEAVTVTVNRRRWTRTPPTDGRAPRTPTN